MTNKANSSQDEADSNEDYVFKFRLDETREPDIYTDRLTEMVRCHLSALLDIVDLTKGGERIGIDGFSFINDPKKVYAIFAKHAIKTEQQ